MYMKSFMKLCQTDITNILSFNKTAYFISVYLMVQWAFVCRFVTPGHS